MPGSKRHQGMWHHPPSSGDTQDSGPNQFGEHLWVDADAGLWATDQPYEGWVDLTDLQALKGRAERIEAAARNVLDRFEGRKVGRWPFDGYFALKELRAVLSGEEE